MLTLDIIRSDVLGTWFGIYHRPTLQFLKPKHDDNGWWTSATDNMALYPTEFDAQKHIDRSFRQLGVEVVRMVCTTAPNLNPEPVRLTTYKRILA